MKKLILAVAAVMVSVAAFAQGVVVFNNRVGADVNARVMLADGTTGAGAGFIAQLYGGKEGTAAGALSALTPTTTFRTSSAAAQGYVNSVNVAIPGVAPGAKAAIVMKAYNGADFASSSIKGESNLITVTVGGDNLPPTNLIGLQGFNLAGGVVVPPTPDIPEPSTIALAVIGAGALLLRRRK